MNEILEKLQSLGPSMWVVIACAVGVLLLVVRLLFKRKPQAETPVEPEPARRSTARTRPVDEGVFGSLTGALAAQIPESEQESSDFTKILRQAGLYSPSSRLNVYAYRFLLLVFPLICAGILAVAAEPGQGWKFMIGGGIVSATLSIIPRLWVYLRRQSRLQQIRNGLADMLDMLSMCLNGGMPLSASLDHVARNLTNYPALAEELQIMRRQSDVGSLKGALRDWANRIDLPEVRQVASILARGEQLGSSLTGNLLDQADHFRQTRKQLATLQANRTPVYMTLPLMFCFAPAVLIILMSPAFMQLTEFFNPRSGGTSLNSIGTTQIVDSLSSLDQTINMNRPAIQSVPDQVRAQQEAKRIEAEQRRDRLRRTLDARRGGN